MDPTAQTLLVGAISGGIVAILIAVGKLIFDDRASQTTAKKSDLVDLRDSYKELQAITEVGYKRLQDNAHADNDRLTGLVEAERTGRQKDRDVCQEQISDNRVHIIELQRQITVLLNRLPPPGTVMPVVIVGTDIPTTAEGKPESSLPVEIAGPLPLPTAAAIAAAIAAEKEKES